MVRKLAAVLALVFVVACVSAKEYKGTITKVDTAKKTVTVKVDGDEKTFNYSDKTEFVKSGKGGKEKAIASADLKTWASKIGPKGAPATITTDEKDGKETVSKVTLGGKRPAPPAPKKVPSGTEE
jgi:hypothetical protein